MSTDGAAGGAAESSGDRPVIAVVGGGMAGLAAAWQLATGLDDGAPAGRPGRVGSGDGALGDVRIVVLEAGSRFGGKVRSTEFCGRTVDVAADAFLARRPEATDLCTELGLDDARVAPGASGAALWARGRLRMMPDGLNLGVPSRWGPLARSGILSAGGAARAALDLVRTHHAEPGATGDRAVGEVVAARLGKQVVERLVDPLIGGIHAGGVTDLSAESTFPPLLVAERRSGSLMRRLRLPPPPSDPGGVTPPVFWSLEGSTARLPAELAEALAARGVALHTGVAVERLDRDGPGDGRWRLTLAGDTAGVSGADGSSDSTRTLTVDGVILAVPAGQASTLLDGHAPLAAGLLAGIQHASVSVVTLAMPVGTIRSHLRGTGFLVPRTSTFDGRPAIITGCTYLTRKWPGLARPDDELIRVSVGRFGDDRADNLDDDELTGAAFAELTSILDIDGRPSQSMVTRWDGAFPQYSVGHLDRTARIEEAVATLGGVAVAGAAYRGVGIPAVVGSGRAAALQVLRSLDAAAPPATTR